MISEIDRVLGEAGLAGRALIAVSLMLWACVYLRANRLRSMRLDVAPTNRTVWLRLVAGYSAQEASKAAPLIWLSWFEQRAMSRAAYLRSALSTLVAVAPLLGLLGTVGGMVEMFESLHAGASGFAEEASLAGGVSQALTSTQLGLLVAIPGLVASRLLVRRERRVTQLIQRICDQQRQMEARCA